MAKRLPKHSYLFLVLGLVLILASCTTATEDENIQTLEDVLQQTLTAPDEELLTELYDPSNGTSIGEGESASSTSESSNGLESLLEDRYGNSFTSYGFDQFTLATSTAFNYSVFADRAGYELTTENIDIVQDEDDANRYAFEVTVNYTTNEGEEETAVVSGGAEFQEGQIAAMNIQDDEGLLQEMIEQAQQTEN